MRLRNVEDLSRRDLAYGSMSERRGEHLKHPAILAHRRWRGAARRQILQVFGGDSAAGVLSRLSSGEFVALLPARWVHAAGKELPRFGALRARDCERERVTLQRRATSPCRRPVLKPPKLSPARMHEDIQSGAIEDFVWLLPRLRRAYRKLLTVFQVQGWDG
jgi:hypothetical protein